MAIEVIWRLGWRDATKIVWGRDDDGTQVRPHAHRHHIFVYGLPEADPRIKALGDDVNKCILDIDLDPHIRIGHQKHRKFGLQHCLSDPGKGSEPYEA